MSSLVGLNLGDYELMERIGVGGMGEVYKARQFSLDRMVAVKILPASEVGNQDYVTRFLLEAKGAASLNHRNLVQIFDAGVSGSLYFYVMELVDGKNLGQIIRQDGPLDEQYALEIIHEAALGLAYAHHMGIVHRDVKPENILMDQKGRVKVGDLGLAKWRLDPEQSALTSVGSTMGTAHYISPEQVRGDSDIDGRADIYSLGMTLYHALSGKPAFPGGNEAEIMARHLSEPVPPLAKIRPGISRFCSDLVDLMVHKDRDRRIQEMAGIANEIERHLGLEETVSRKYLRGSENRFKREFFSLTHAWRMLASMTAGLTLAAVVLMIWTFVKPLSEGQDSQQAVRTPSAGSKEALPDSGQMTGGDGSGLSRGTGAEVDHTVQVVLTGLRDWKTISIFSPTNSQGRPPPYLDQASLNFRKAVPLSGLVVSRYFPFESSKALLLLRKKSSTMLSIEKQFRNPAISLVRATLELSVLQLAPSTNLELQCFATKREWGFAMPTQFPKTETGEIIRWRAGMEPQDMGVLLKFCEVLQKETSWNVASFGNGKRKPISWKEDGATSFADCDYLQPLTGIDLKTDFFHFMSRVKKRSKPDTRILRVDVTPTVRRYLEHIQGALKDASPAPGWIVSAKAGVGEIYLASAYHGAGPKLLLDFRPDASTNPDPKGAQSSK
jgi:eukaryotic-like serine/threonine-protein kinase